MLHPAAIFALGTVTGSVVTKVAGVAFSEERYERKTARLKERVAKREAKAMNDRNSAE